LFEGDTNGSDLSRPSGLDGRKLHLDVEDVAGQEINQTMAVCPWLQEPRSGFCGECKFTAFAKNEMSTPELASVNL
jgi:hypothetical protein